MENKEKYYKKWWFWLIILVVIIGIIILATRSNTNTTGNPVTYTSTGTQEIQRTSNQDLKSNISIEALGLANNGDFIIKVTNNNDVPVCIEEISTIYKDKDNNFMEKVSSDNQFFGIDAKSSTIVYNWSYKKDFSQYPNYEFEFDFANIADSFLYSNFEIKANNTGKQIAIQVKNNNQETAKDISVNVVYYKNGKVVGITGGSNYETPTEQGKTAYINASYPEDSNYNELSFDNYEVYFVQASKE